MPPKLTPDAVIEGDGGGLAGFGLLEGRDRRTGKGADQRQPRHRLDQDRRRQRHEGGDRAGQKSKHDVANPPMIADQ